jgi:aryl-phospho-beta-D-glucosidase BglC (GH1 family)
MVSNGHQPLDATTGDNATKGKSARRRREPYSWLGIGALSIGVGAAALTNGSGLAYADDSATGASSAGQSESASSANSNGSKASAVGKSRATSNRSARAAESANRSAAADSSRLEKSKNHPTALDAAVSEPAAAKLTTPAVELPTSAASTLPPPSGGSSTPTVQPSTASAVRVLPAIFSAVSTEAKPQLPSVLQLPQQLLAPIQAVFKLFGGLPANPSAPELSPVLSLLWGAFRRTETSQPTARASALATTSAPQSAATTVGPSASYSVTSDWGSGHTAAVAVNSGDTALNGWTVEFDSPAQITNIWNGQITSHVGTHYVISNMSYNAKVSAGQSTSFGYQASGSGAAGTPTNVKVNGVASGTPVTPPTVSIADATVTEGNSGTSDASFTVTLSKAATTPVTVGYATSGGTATSGTDFTAATGTLTFAPGVTAQTIIVKVTGDTTVEPNETFNVGLSNPSGATISRGTAVGTITNDDVAPTPSISIANASVAEGNSGTSNASFTVTLSNASTTPVTVGYSTSNGTATAGTDYTAASGTLTFAPGTTSQTVTVKVIGDTTVESDETFNVTLSNPTGGTISKSTAVGTITNDDVAAPPPSITISNASVAEGNSGTTDAAFTVSLSNASTTPVTVAYATSNGTATAGADYTAASGTLTFAPGTTSQTVTVKVAGDTTVESDETFNVTLSSPTGATIAKATAVGTITNDDVATPTPGGASVGYAVSNEWNSGYNANMTVNAGQTAINGWTVEFDSPAEIVNIWNAQITSHVGTHYVISNMTYNGQVAAGQNTSFGYQANGTSAAGVPTNLKVNGVAVGSPATQPTLSIANISVAEGNSGTKDATFTVALSQTATSAVTVGYATSNGTATAGADYTATSGTLTFAPGTTSQTITVKIVGDTTAESDETFNVTLSNPSGATIARATAVATITNDDAGTTPSTPGMSISDASVSEPGTGGIASGFLHTSGNQIVDSQGKPVQLTGVNWFGAQSSNGVPDGLWTRNYKEMIDQMAGQGFNVIRIPYASALLHTSAAPSGINYYANPDLQGLSRMEVLDKIIDYAGQQGMRVILDHHRSTAGAGTSENGLWYDSQYTEDAWVADWQTLATRYKNNPTVIGFDLHNEPYNGTWGGGGANDWARAAERAGNAALAINPNLLIIVEGVGSYKGDNYWWGGQLQGVKDRPITLNVANRVVYSPHDYPNSVWQQPWFQGDNFGAGLPAKFRSEWGYIYEQNIAPIYIGEFGTKLQDPKDAVWLEAITSYLSGDFDNNGTIDIPAGTEDMSWTFWSWNPNSGDTGGILADDWKTINENKMAYLKPIEYTGGNGTSVATFTVSLAAPSTQTVTVQYATANGTALAGSDYSATSGTLTFAPGETQKTITVVVKGDNATEGNENFTILLSSPVGATLTDASGTGTIIDRVGTA